MLQTTTPNRLRYATVDVFDAEGEAIRAEYKGKELEYKKWNEIIYEQPKILDSKGIAGDIWVVKRSSRPKKNHPWR